MIGVIIVIVIIILACANLGGQAAATSNCKREAREDWAKKDAQWQQYERDLAKQTDTYYNAGAKSRNTWFYGDGSLKQDPMTGKTYQKGQYRATSHGIDCNMNQAGPGVKRAPRN